MPHRLDHLRPIQTEETRPDRCQVLRCPGGAYPADTRGCAGREPMTGVGGPRLPGETQDGLVGSPRHRREQDGCRRQAHRKEVSGGAYASGDHGGTGARLAHRRSMASAGPRLDRLPFSDIRAARHRDRWRLRRWDRNHLHEFTLTEGTIITPHGWWDGEEPDLLATV